MDLVWHVACNRYLRVIVWHLCLVWQSGLSFLFSLNRIFDFDSVTQFFLDYFCSVQYSCILFYMEETPSEHKSMSGLSVMPNTFSGLRYTAHFT